MNAKICDYRGQCYDGASNMKGAKKGVAGIIRWEESRALYTHYYEHSLNPAVIDTVKRSKNCRDALDMPFEVTKLIKFPLREIQHLIQSILVIRMMSDWTTVGYGVWVKFRDRGPNGTT
ncbi:Zinc finger MYM-type protein 1-like [Oopsacas minuta]|uniref:Zinc finger MYM-type protein 1-like n=1 Tax=Oopsacas minuta TaxID=111878 RepID=A0AAV7KAK0_9METZ|nr:Zinc finger MYM-type protein 1-like [Oopsacas minuta]